MPSETFINENELSLLSLMNTIGPLKNQLYVQQTTYIAQELDWVNTNYNFDFELGFPFSNQLESDLSCLESKELVYNTNSKLGGKSAPLAKVPFTTRILSNTSERENMNCELRIPV